MTRARILTYPPHRAVSVAEARAADRLATETYGVPSLVLMEHAGRGLAALVAARRTGPGPVVVVCGPGANGGDGFACARFLASWGVAVRVLAAARSGSSASDAALERALAARDVVVEELEDGDADSRLAHALRDASALVDALYGVGLSRALSPHDASLVRRMNASACVRVAADVPSGLHGDDGVELPCAVRADVTAAMGFVKVGCTVGAGPRCSGELVEIDIGLPRALHALYARPPAADDADDARPR